MEHMAKMKYPLMPHQINGVKWMLERESPINPIKGGLLSDDPGLGKTIQMCACMVGNPVNRTLFIVPTSVIDQWKKILLTLFPNKTVEIHRGHARPNNYSDIFRKYRKTTFVITTPGTMRKDIHKLNIISYWDRIVFDEVHTIRNRNSTYKAAILLNSHIKWGLSGTPIQNRRDDIMNIYRFLGICEVGRPCQMSIMALNGIYMKRRLKTEEAKKNPKMVLGKKTEIQYQLDFDTQEERDMYDRIKRNTTRDYANMANSAASTRQQMLFFFELLMRQRQASIHPQLALNGLSRKFGVDMGHYNGPSTKITKLVELIGRRSGLMVQSKRAVNCLVFCHFKEEMEMIGRELTKKGITHLKYTGSMTDKQRRDCLNSFSHYKMVYDKVLSKKLPEELCMEIQSYSSRVLLMQISAGGVGLNLQQFTDVFFTLADWNPSNEVQAIARAHRLGQSQEVTVHKLYLHVPDPDYGTIDDRILEVQEQKMKIVNKCMGNKGMDHLSMSDFRRLLA
jgi:SNF2 family DNA or RNA helicase